MAYDFLSGHSAEHFHRKGFRPKIGEGSFKRIEDIDFTELVNRGEAFITDEDAYVIGDGRRDPVYFYKRKYHFFYNENTRGTPKFHILKCETINQHGVDAFQASNTPTAIVRNSNRSRGERQYQLTLTLCGNCRKAINESPGETTEAFYEALRTRYQEEQDISRDVPLDFNGYILDWPQISKRYKKSKNYTCGNPRCKLQIIERADQKFLHTHHVNGNKTDNRPENLQCLCVLCHSKEHEGDGNDKFESRKMQRQLKLFLERYGDELRRLGNPYV